MYMPCVYVTFFSRAVYYVMKTVDACFPNMEIIAATDLYFDGTREYMVVARSFANYGGS